jgi:hypothetical protein
VPLGLYRSQGTLLHIFWVMALRRYRAEQGMLWGARTLADRDRRSVQKHNKKHIEAYFESVLQISVALSLRPFQNIIQTLDNGD